MYLFYTQIIGYTFEYQLQYMVSDTKSGGGRNWDYISRIECCILEPRYAFMSYLNSQFER